MSVGACCRECPDMLINTLFKGLSKHAAPSVQSATSILSRIPQTNAYKHDICPASVLEQQRRCNPSSRVQTSFLLPLSSCLRVAQFSLLSEFLEFLVLFSWQSLHGRQMESLHRMMHRIVAPNGMSRFIFVTGSLKMCRSVALQGR